MIYWFTGASTQAVTTGAYRAVEFIKANIKLEGVEKASVEDSKKVVEICTKYAQKGMLNIFIAVFFGTLAFAFHGPVLDQAIAERGDMPLPPYIASRREADAEDRKRTGPSIGFEMSTVPLDFRG